jgi:hypothetical protein
MARFDVRRMAAVDMYGGGGRLWRRRVILAEFVAGTVLCPALGLFTLGVTADAGGRLLGAWLIGMGLNYLPLAVHAATLSPAGALEAELAGVDVRRELRYYSLAQLLVLVPLAVLVVALAQTRRPA